MKNNNKINRVKMKISKWIIHNKQKNGRTKKITKIKKIEYNYFRINMIKKKKNW